MENDIGKILSSELRSRSLDLDRTEVEYLASALVDVVGSVKGITPSSAVFKQTLNDTTDILLPILSEYGLEEADVMKIAQSIYTSVCGLSGVDSVAPDSNQSDSTPLRPPVLDLEDITLAYMDLELLRRTSLRLYPGKVYGLIGQNGIGKTTLLSKLAACEVPGMSGKIITGVVGHELVGHELETPRDLINNTEMLRLVGFEGPNEHLANVPCGCLSGGWKMKVSLGLTFSKTSELDLLLLDEPTNHLDKESVLWLSQFLQSPALSNTATLIVSHDAGFLDATIDYVIHFRNFELKTIKSDFTTFIKSERLDPATLVPLSQLGVASLTASVRPFHLPKPGPLDGIKSNTQTIAKLENVSFEYDKFGITNFSARLTLSSRVAMVGPNGAGKSTMVNLLVGKLTPSKGLVYRHPNLRIAFVSQHHIHHLEEYNDKSCLQYFVDRFGAGVDKEVLSVASMQESKYEELDRVAKAKKYAKINIKAGRGGVHALIGRRKNFKSFEYQVVWEGYLEKDAEWLSRAELETELGVGKMCVALDSVIAQKKANTDQRELDHNSIKKYLSDFGVLAHTAEGKIGGLSGGQKTRLVLAASMWQHPHLVILDEPTNYLDMASLESLLNALRSFHGGVLVISHNKEFVNRFANEVWEVDKGRRINEE